MVFLFKHIRNVLDVWRVTCKVTFDRTEVLLKENVAPN